MHHAEYTLHLSTLVFARLESICFGEYTIPLFLAFELAGNFLELKQRKVRIPLILGFQLESYRRYKGHKVFEIEETTGHLCYFEFTAGL